MTPEVLHTFRLFGWLTIPVLLAGMMTLPALFAMADDEKARPQDDFVQGSSAILKVWLVVNGFCAVHVIVFFFILR